MLGSVQGGGGVQTASFCRYCVSIGPFRGLKEEAEVLLKTQAEHTGRAQKLYMRKLHEATFRVHLPAIGLSLLQSPPLPGAAPRVLLPSNFPRELATLFVGNLSVVMSSSSAAAAAVADADAAAAVASPAAR